MTSNLTKNNNTQTAIAINIAINEKICIPKVSFGMHIVETCPFCYYLPYFTGPISPPGGNGMYLERYSGLL